MTSFDIINRKPFLFLVQLAIQQSHENLIGWENLVQLRTNSLI